MFKNSSKMMFLLILVFSTMVSISSNSWIGAWMGLEINLLAFIPLVTANNNLMSSEASLKYFLIQAMASSILMFAIMLFSIKMNTLFQIDQMINMTNMMLMSSLLLKMGAAPFHFWFPSVMEGLSWMNSLLLMTWQKIAPLMLLSYLIMDILLFPVIIMSVIIGSLGGLNQTSLRKIMAFSSINHLGWMVAAMISSETLWILYFLIYFFLSLTLVILFNSYKMLYMNQLFSMFSSSKTMKFMLFINLLSLGGLPPFIGFLPKWLVIQSLTFNNQLFLMTLMTIFTLITLFFYIRMCYSAFMLNYSENNWTIFTQIKSFYIYSYMIMTFISVCLLFSISFVYLTM
uniref:NADH dehydrogenase subunit 2 n=1 Tax=Saropogon luteus TaxID=468801 RepID=UPI0031F37589